MSKTAEEWFAARYPDFIKTVDSSLVVNFLCEAFDAGRASRDEEHKAEVKKLVAAFRHWRDIVEDWEGAEVDTCDKCLLAVATLAAYPEEGGSDAT